MFHVPPSLQNFVAFHTVLNNSIAFFVVKMSPTRRVHISEVTLSFLNEGFEVEPAHGEKREEILRIAGIKTYFIVRPMKSVCPSISTSPLLISNHRLHHINFCGLNKLLYKCIASATCKNSGKVEYVCTYLTTGLQLREGGIGATENGDVPPDDIVITKDLPSDLHSTFAEDSNVSIKCCMRVKDRTLSSQSVGFVPPRSKLSECTFQC